MTRLGPEELAGRTLRRQFPDLPGRGPDDVLALFDRLGPIQSQVPRAPFLAASSRLPGVAYDTVNGLFADHRLVKTSSLRGTVHTSTAAIIPPTRCGGPAPASHPRPAAPGPRTGLR